MARPGKHKAKFDRYKAHNHIAENKRKRQERHEKRMAKFAKRRELKAQGHVFDGPSGRNYWNYDDRSNKTTKGHNAVSKSRSLNRKLDNFLAKQKIEMKEKERSFNGKKKKSVGSDS